MAIAVISLQRTSTAVVLSLQYPSPQGQLARDARYLVLARTRLYLVAAKLRNYRVHS